MRNIINKIQTAIYGTEFEGKTFLVGGYVRDSLLNIPCFDLDITVELPNGGAKLAAFLYKRKIASKPVLYENFGTSFVKIDGCKVELLMTRKESYREKDRKPDVEPATLSEDIERRDFTINTLAIDISTGKLLDITGKGLIDLEKKIIRTVNEPATVFEEDPLRLLRAIRFSQQLHFSIEKQTEKAIFNCSEELDYISWERKKEELDKMLLLPKPSEAMWKLMDLHLMKYIIPELLELEHLEQNRYHHLDALNHTLLVLDLTEPILLNRYATLLHDIGKKSCFFKDESGKIHFHQHEIVSEELAKMILSRLTCSHKFIEDASFIIKNHMRFKTAGEKGEIISDKALRRIILESGNRLDALLDVVHADNRAHAEAYSLPKQVPMLKERIKKLNFPREKHKMPIDGNIIKSKFSIQEGKKVGEMLEKAEEIWLENPEITSEELIRKLELQSEKYTY